jgi:hypothetical protein
MAQRKSYSKKWSEAMAKTGPTSRWINQGFSVVDSTLGERANAYEKWLGSKSRQKESNAPQSEARTEIGSVTSSWLTSLGYDADTGEAMATFHDTNQVFYYPMPWADYVDWKRSPSKGKWLYASPEFAHNYRTEPGAAIRGKQTERTPGRYETRLRKDRYGNKRASNYAAPYR